MRWFKHMAGASRDAFVVDLEARFGLEGYARWFKLLEVVAEQCRPERGEWSVSYPEATWARLLSAKRKILRTFLEYCRNVSRIKAEYSGNIITIEICNMQKIKDNHAGNLQATCKRLASKDSEEESKSITPLSPLSGGGASCGSPGGPEKAAVAEPEPAKKKRRAPAEFSAELQVLWKMCPEPMRECGRLAVLNVWETLKKNNRLPEQEQLVRALGKYIDKLQRLADPKWAHLRTWLNQGRWDTGEELEQVKESERRQVVEERERAQETAQERAQAIEKWWADQWQKVPEDVKEKWRVHVCDKNNMLAQAKERGQDMLVEIGARGAWRTYQENKKREKAEGGEAGQGPGQV